MHAVAEVRRYRARDASENPFVSGRRLVRRLLAALVVVGVVGGVYWGLTYPDTLGDHRGFVRYWTTCLAGVFALLMLAVLDLRETRVVATRAMRDELDRAIRLLEERASSRAERRSEPPPADDRESEHG